MFETLVIHPLSRAALCDFMAAPAHAVLLYGPESNGKSLIARELAANLLGCSLDELAKQPELLEIKPDEAGKIGIETVRSIVTFVSLKTLGTGTIRRVVLLQDADRLTVPAQQALLKVVEEPPEDTVIMFVTSLQHRLLPTIASRVRRIFIRRPEAKQLAAFLESHGVRPEAVSAATLLGGGNIGAALAYQAHEDPETEQVGTRVRRIIGLPLFDQLLLVDTELKETTAAVAFAADLSRFAEASLHRSAGTAASEQWLRISAAAAKAVEYLGRKTNTKLVMTELMLSLRYMT